MAFSAEGGRQGRGAAFERHITERLQRAQEVHQRGLIPPVLSGCAGVGGLAFAKALALGSPKSSDLGIDIRGLQRHVPEPSADCVDVNAGA